MKLWFRMWFNHLQGNLKYKLQQWLGLNNLSNKISDVNRVASLVSSQVQTLRNDFYSQMAMVGVDAQPFSKALNKHVQTQVIFISRMGQGGEGTIKIVDTYFESPSELFAYIHLLEARIPPERILIDAPPGMAESFELPNRKHRW